MTVKEFSKYLFSGAKVKLVDGGIDIFIGRANELTDCPYADYDVNVEGIQTLSDNVIRISVANSMLKIPQEFDSYEVPQRCADRMIRPKIPVHITILGSFIHYFTKEKRYSIRIESTGLFDAEAIEEYRTISEKELRQYLEEE